MSQAPVMIVEDDADLGEALCYTLSEAGIETLHAPDGETALDLLARRPVSVVVSDVQMPGMGGEALLEEIRRRRPELPVILMTAYGTVRRAVAAMRAGATDYLLKPFDAERLVELVRRHLRPATQAANDASGLVARDPRMLRVVRIAERVARSDVTVMITGESGTGKEVLARHIHACSERADGPFVAINCAAIPENMLEAVLFGHEKGAFTGAYQARAGKFEQAQGGTLLLDEISEMELGLQAKLLRVLQEREVERIGGKAPIALDVRVLATSNRNLREEVRAGRFREDLFYRLNVFPLRLPPLRERPDDVLAIAEALLERLTPPGMPVRPLCEAARRRLQAHHWPGNVRELENVLQRAVILAQGPCIAPEDLHFDPELDPGAEGEKGAAAEAPAGGSALGEDLRSREHQLILDALARHRSRKAAAEALGISPRTLRYKLARMRAAGIEIPR
ncbi:MAG: sigma-54-dependent Fis family transcriptional regulator [Gammaproteobacteria bacterium]|nr:MAG: sigma-54-dependent Fis family transcriptional regulator [Gammaproteobacteria bacterium]